MHCFGVSSSLDDFLCWRTARVASLSDLFLFYSIASARLMVSSFMDEFISFHGKRNEPKKSRPYRVGLRLLCALQLRPAAAELAGVV
jgi:hypothetical protein